VIWIGIVLFVLVDALVVAAVLQQVKAKRGWLGGTAIGEVARFSRAAAEETSAYMTANYGGDAAALPGVLQGLVERLAERAKADGLTIDREALKQIASTTVILQKTAPARDVNAAMNSVA
jgi:hypothetical protein